MSIDIVWENISAKYLQSCSKISSKNIFHVFSLEFLHRVRLIQFFSYLQTGNFKYFFYVKTKWIATHFFLNVAFLKNHHSVEFDIYICSCLMFRDKKKFNFLMSCPWWFPSFEILQRVQNIQWNAWITTIEGLKLKNCHCRLHSIKSISHAPVQNLWPFACPITQATKSNGFDLVVGLFSLSSVHPTKAKVSSQQTSSFQRPSHISGFPIVHFVPEKWWEYSDGSK